MDDAQKIERISDLYRELIAVLRVNILRGVILVRGGETKALEDAINLYEKKFLDLDPPEEPKCTIIFDPKMDWETLEL